MNIVSIALKNDIQLLSSYIELGISERITLEDMKLIVKSVDERIVIMVARAILPDINIYYLMYKLYSISLFSVKQWKEILECLDEKTIIELLDNISGYYGYENIFQCIRRGYIVLAKLIISFMRYSFTWKSKNEASIDEVLFLGEEVTILADELDYDNILALMNTPLHHRIIGNNKLILTKERLIYIYNTYPIYRRDIILSFSYNPEDIEYIIHEDFPISIMQFYDTHRELVTRNIQYVTPKQIYTYCYNNSIYPNELVQLLIGKVLEDEELVDIHTIPEVLIPCFKNARVRCNPCYNTSEYNVLYRKLKAIDIKNIRYSSITVFHAIFLYEFTQSNLTPYFTIANDYDLLTYYIGILCPNGLKRLYEFHNDMPIVIHTYFKLFPHSIDVINKRFADYCELPKKNQPYIGRYKALEDIDIR